MPRSIWFGGSDWVGGLEIGELGAVGFVESLEAGVVDLLHQILRNLEARGKDPQCIDVHVMRE